MIRVLLIAPIPALRLGLRALLADSDAEIVGEADRLDSPDLNGAEADVIIHASASATRLDLEPDSASGAAILALTDDRPTVQALMTQTGVVWGALPLESSREELLAALHALSEGLVVSAPQFVAPQPSLREAGEHPALSEREIEVLGLLAQGKANSRSRRRWASVSTPSSSTFRPSSPSWKSPTAPRLCARACAADGWRCDLQIGGNKKIKIPYNQSTVLIFSG